MRTEDDLTTLLRRGFTRATADLDPRPDLVQVVRRRHASARRRRLAVRVAVPAAAIAAGSGLALAVPDAPNHGPSRAAVAGPPPSPPATRASAPRTTPISYRVVLGNHRAPANCPANATTPISKSANPAGVWFFADGQCVFVGVGGADTKPANAVPLPIEGRPGLYTTLENGVRTIYAPGIGGRGWWVLTMPATTPPEVAVRVIVPTN